jgi:hypothetical protein
MEVNGNGCEYHDTSNGNHGNGCRIEVNEQRQRLQLTTQHDTSNRNRCRMEIYHDTSNGNYTTMHYDNHT